MLQHHFDRLQKIDRLIRIKATGTPEQLTQKLGISERSFLIYQVQIGEWSQGSNYMLKDSQV